MMRIKSNLNLIVLYILILLLIPFLAFQAHVHNLRVRLIRDADHVAILEACRNLSKEVHIGNLEAGLYRIYPDPNKNKFELPECILELKPTSIYLDEKDRYAQGCAQIRIDLKAFKYWLALNAYLNDDLNARHSIDKELIPGLRYYEPSFDRDPNYLDKEIDWLLSQRSNNI